MIQLQDGVFALVDASDYNRLNKFRWFLRKSHSCYYVVRRVRRHERDTFIKLHREITHARPDQVVHHNNHNILDNRNFNLTVTSPKDHLLLHKEGH